MHEAGLVFIPSFERVGGEEHDRQSEKSAQTSQLRKVAKAVSLSRECNNRALLEFQHDGCFDVGACNNDSGHVSHVETFGKLDRNVEGTG